MPNDSLYNPFNEDHSSFSAFYLGKGKSSGQWITIYNLKHIAEDFRVNNMVPVGKIKITDPLQFKTSKGSKSINA